MLAESESDPRRGSAVHAAQESLGRDLASGGGLGVIRPGIAPGGPCTAPGRANVSQHLSVSADVRFHPDYVRFAPG